jgi:hypothetical protein
MASVDNTRRTAPENRANSAELFRSRRSDLLNVTTAATDGPKSPICWSVRINEGPGSMKPRGRRRLWFLADQVVCTT